MTTIQSSEFFKQLQAALSGNGAFLVVEDGKGSANPMTIGWAMQGFVWQKHVLQVLVRPSRFTHDLLERTDMFSVCVPGHDMKKALAVCGTKSGRDTDKARECALAIVPGENPGIRIIRDCEFICECRTVAKMQMAPGKLFDGGNISGKFYPAGDFHTVYYGEILAIYRNGQ
jgi:flavin reductase (DIM6/NTAB) family NADH-FMN oxidoreductase RutF